MSKFSQDPTTIIDLLQMPIESVTRLEEPYTAISRVKVYGSGETARPVLVFHNATFHKTTVD